jgi:hypothetical protein
MIVKSFLARSSKQPAIRIVAEGGRVACQLCLLSTFYYLREGWQRGSRLVYSQTGFGDRSA